MPILDGTLLGEARVKKGWTQVELSEATKPRVDVSTISRIERGPTRVRAKTLEALSNALEIQRESLCPVAEAERDVMKLRIGSAARNALTLVALRYKIKREHVIEIAPLLFFIAAEQSLRVRQEKITGMVASARALLALYDGIPHLPSYWPVDEGVVSSEEESIKARDLFGKKVLEGAPHLMSERHKDYDEAERNPFVAFLRDGVARVGQSPEAPDSIRWEPYSGPSYEICAEEASSIVGNDIEATRAIVSGDAPLHEMPKGSPEERAEWARERARITKTPDGEC